MPRIDELLRYLKERRGSDLHLAATMEPRVRISGTLRPVEGWAKLQDDELCALLREITTPAQWSAYRETLDIDFAYGLEGVARFRCNFFNQQNGAGAVLRIIPDTILSIQALKLPPVIERFVDLDDGLVLVTGPTGSGKSTTLAAIIDAINAKHGKHILTIEDPIEFVHRNNRALVSQREIGQHADSFADALTAAIRQDPDVILVGEMRDRETIGLALKAAEMGALVFGTLHTNSAVKTVDRLIDAFPADEQEPIRLSLADTLTGIVSQLLLPTADGRGRCAVNEILLRTTALPNLIREKKTQMLRSLIEGGRAMGMQAMDDALAHLVDEGTILAQDAYMKAQDKARFERMLPAV